MRSPYLARVDGSPYAAEQEPDRPSSGPASRARKLTHDNSGLRVRSSRLLLADCNARTRDLLRPKLAGVATEIHDAHDGAELERALLEAGPYQLVVASARLPEPSALQVLARIRRQGITTPFIVVASLSVHERRMRVFVSDSEGTVLSSRVLDDDNLAVLAAKLIHDGADPG